MNQPLTLAFDVYGTLINTHGVIVALKEHVGEKASNFSQRSPNAIFDSWGIEPTVTVNSLSELAGQITQYDQL